jgi:hypothetical protein
VESTIPLKPYVVETATVEIGPVVPCEERLIVPIVNVVTEVAVPGGVVIVGIPGEIGIADDFGSADVGILVNDRGRCGRISIGVNNGAGCDIYPGGRRNEHPRTGYTETDTRIYVYLGIAFCSDQAGGYNGGEND